MAEYQTGHFSLKIARFPAPGGQFTNGFKDHASPV